MSIVCGNVHRPDLSSGSNLLPKLLPSSYVSVIVSSVTTFEFRVGREPTGIE